MYDLSINVFAPFAGEEGENIATADVILYGTEDLVICHYLCLLIHNLISA